PRLGGINSNRHWNEWLLFEADLGGDGGGQVGESPVGKFPARGRERIEQTRPGLVGNLHLRLADILIALDVAERPQADEVRRTLVGRLAGVGELPAGVAVERDG